MESRVGSDSIQQAQDQAGERWQEGAFLERSSCQGVSERPERHRTGQRGGSGDFSFGFVLWGRYVHAPAVPVDTSRKHKILWSWLT